MTHDEHPPEDTDAETPGSSHSPTLLGRLRRAFGRTAPGGASSTPSPTQGRSSGVSAPGAAETARHQGAPNREVEAEGGRDLDTLHTAQREILRPIRDATTAAGEPVVKSVQPTIRRFTGDKRDQRIGPLRFTVDELSALEVATAEHGYKGEGGFAADVVVAFISGRFTANLPLSEDRRRTQHFRAQVLRQLNRIGVNINQIARALNSDLTPPDIRQHLVELQMLLELIAETLRDPAGPVEGEEAAA
ncbi:MobC family plasmid mobilization relaxosome protein [Streptomyces sp. CHD11]|nr:MobC family plasmid mobilization relaxosome protein [Streptomyces sp. CHD11]